MVHSLLFAAVLCVLASLSNAYMLGMTTVTTTPLGGGAWRVKAVLKKKMMENIGWTAVCFGNGMGMAPAQCVAGMTGAVSRWETTAGRNFQAVSGADGDISDASLTVVGKTVTLEFTATSLSGTPISSGFSKILAAAGKLNPNLTPAKHMKRRGIAKFNNNPPTKKPTKSPTPRPTRSPTTPRPL